ncbi:hypothetical protein [Microbacterium xylanilyticum]
MIRNGQPIQKAEQHTQIITSVDAAEDAARAALAEVIAAREQRERDERDAALQARRQAEAAYLATPEGRAAAARQAAENEEVEFHESVAELAEQQAQLGLQTGSTPDRLQGTRDAIRAKSAMLAAQVSNSNGYRA